MLFTLFLNYHFYKIGNEDLICDVPYLNFVSPYLCLILCNLHSICRLHNTVHTRNALKISLLEVGLHALWINLSLIL
jgi:hypothetical protein